MIIIKSKHEIDLMRTAGKVTAKILRDLEDIVKPGVSTKEISDYIEDVIRQNGMVPTFKGLYGFPAAACVSLNEQVVHGIPSEKIILKEGDIVSVDTGATYKGYVSDAARTYAVGEISDEAKRLIDTAKDGFFAALEFCREGNHLSDISHAVQSVVEGAGFGVIRDFVGHGLGQDLHEEPQIPNYGKPGKGPRLKEGMVIAIEPMISAGSYEVETLMDNWTAVTIDGSLAAHYENTVVITDGEPELLTL